MYDLTDYVNTLSVFNSDSAYEFLDSDIVDVFKQQSGQDITKPLNAVLAKKDASTVEANMNCLGNAFFVGNNDFRKTHRCQVQNILLLVVSIILMVTIASKCKYLFQENE